MINMHACHIMIGKRHHVDNLFIILVAIHGDLLPIEEVHFLSQQ